jgi:hypothetical protein
MNTQHTPGPWEFSDEYVRGLDKNVEGSDYHGNVIADTRLYGYNEASEKVQKQRDANGVLIAAAPTLLQTLKQINADAKELLREDTIFSRVANNYLTTLISETELAIHKATTI